MADVLSSIFSAEGLLSQSLDSYTPRQAQLQMAQYVEQCLHAPVQPTSISEQNILLCEAGTGTGKTFAYLVPAILSKKQIIISTGTKNLQDQLYYNDLPVITELLEPLTQRQSVYAVLKGRRNYVCLYRFKKALNDAWYDELIQQALQQITRQISQTRFADKAEFSGLQEQSGLWPMITSSSDNCLGIACPDHDECYVLKAREKAFSADIVVVNHHLLIADMKLKKDALGELLPVASSYIIDEAHQLPDIITHFFSQEVSSQKIKSLLKDSRYFIKHSAVSIPQHQERFSAYNDDLRQLLDDIALVLQRYKSRGSWSEVSHAITPLCDELIHSLRKLTTFLSALASNSAELDNCAKRSDYLLSDVIKLTDLSIPESSTEDNSVKNVVHWFECTRKSFAIHHTLLSMSDEFLQQFNSLNANWIFTSATLAIAPYQDGNKQKSDDHRPLFSYFAQQLSLKKFTAICLQSPFNFSQQAILFAPQNLPLPSEPSYISLLMRSILPIIEYLEGKTFLLFTSYRALQEAQEILHTLDFNLYVQGELPKQQLLNKFKCSERGILLGTSSFWEGVDVKGEALSCVVIDKLPFASPYEPVMQAKLKHLTQAGINAFYHYQLPQTAISLKQGIGRLIRDNNDYGIIVIADPRLFTKAYGYYLRQTLADIPIETDLYHLYARLGELKNSRKESL